MSHGREADRAESPGRLPASAVPVLMFVITLIVVAVLVAVLAPLFGLTVGRPVWRTGDATISGCTRTLVITMHSCRAEIAWEGEPPSGVPLEHGPDYRILTRTPLAGTVRVEGHPQRSVRGVVHEVIIPAGAPARQSVITTALLFLAALAVTIALTWIEVMISRRLRSRLAAT